ncbi:hypothetical protein FM020_13380 [Acinetobacter tandoii]|nr:hypothetical protein FM020_13380 [Acinetobacter tandoii]
MSQSPIILALTDGKAGHETQTQGIVQLLNQQQQYQVEWLKLKFPSKWQYRILKWLMKFSADTAWLNAFLTTEQLDNLEHRNVAYIVSAGGNTLLANALLKLELSKTQTVKNIVASSLRGIKAHYFDVVFTIHPLQENLDHYLYYPIAPNKMCALPLTKEQARINLGISYLDQVITILIGADTKTVSIGTVEEWGAVLQKVRSEYPEARLLLTTSRRTSIEFEHALANYCTQHNLVRSSDQMTWVAQGQQCDIKNYILAADWVLSSADSTSMVAEVVMSGQPLIVFSDASKMHDAAIQQQLSFLERQKWISCYDLSNTVQFKQALQFLEPDNHSEAMANELKKRLAL